MSFNLKTNRILPLLVLLVALGFTACANDDQAFIAGDDVPTSESDPYDDNSGDTDFDEDGVVNTNDNCLYTSNADQSDSDADGVGDDCDADIDGDGLANDSDNCALVANADQADMDADGFGDVCDDDIDGDGVDNDEDEDPYGAEIIDEDEDGYDVDSDCDDTDASVYPGAPEEAGSGVDSNCDGELTTLTFTGFTSIEIASQTGSAQFAKSATAIGDINSDGFEDYVIAAPEEDSTLGKVYLFLGSADFGTANLSPADAHASFKGARNRDLTGYSVSSGDFNGDGKTDIAIGAPGARMGSSKRNGVVYILFAPDDITTWSGEQNIANAADITFGGENPDDNFGLSVSLAGDANGDGKADLLVGAPEFGNAAGKAYLIFGSDALSGSVDLSSLDPTTQIATFASENDSDNFGSAVAFVGNVNADSNNLSEFAIAAPSYSTGIDKSGKVYLYAGAESYYDSDNSTNEMTSTDTLASFVGVGAKDYLGTALLKLEDWNADGIHDFALGSMDSDIDYANAGRVYIFFGSETSSWTQDQGVDTADILIVGVEEQLKMGSALTAGDVNGDGTTDLIVGAKQASSDSLNTVGATYVFYGRDDSLGLLTNLEADLSFMGTADNEKSGSSLSFLGDVNGDGVPEILVGAPENSQIDTEAGKAYILTATTE